MSLTVGDLLIDYSYARPSLAEAVKAGCKGALRYTAGSASLPSHPSYRLNKGKLITPAEHASILAAGLDVIANDEWYTDRVTEGYDAGYADGLAAKSIWKACGHAKGSTIYVSWDAYPAPSKFPAVARYAAGYKKALAGYYEFDGYGGTGFLRWALKQGFIHFGWRPNAGSWSNDGLPYQPDTSTASKRLALVNLALGKTPAHIWQTGNYWFNKTADENLVLRLPVGSHLEALTPAPKPVPVPIPPVVPPNGKDFLLDADAAARFDRVDAEIKDLKAYIRLIVSDSTGKGHGLRAWFTKLAGKKIDLAP